LLITEDSCSFNTLLNLWSLKGAECLERIRIDLLIHSSLGLLGYLHKVSTIQHISLLQHSSAVVLFVYTLEWLSLFFFFSFRKIGLSIVSIASDFDYWFIRTQSFPDLFYPWENSGINSSLRYKSKSRDTRLYSVLLVNSVGR